MGPDIAVKNGAASTSGWSDMTTRWGGKKKKDPEILSVFACRLRKNLPYDFWLGIVARNLVSYLCIKFQVARCIR